MPKIFCNRFPNILPNVGAGMDNKYKEKQIIKANNSIANRLLFGIIIILLTMVPVFLRPALIEQIHPSINLFIMDNMQIDIASYYKFLILLIGTLAIIAVFSYRIFRERQSFRLDYTTVPLLALILLILISGVTAQYKSISLIGLSWQHEGTLTYICYLILFFVTANLSYNGKKIRWFFYALYPFLLANLVLSLFYFYGFNILTTDLGNFIAANTIPIDTARSIAEPYFQNTLGNPDYLSGVGGMLTALFLTRGVLIKDTKAQIWNIFIATLSFALVLASFATNGFLTIILIIPLIAFFIFFSKDRKKGLVALLAAMLAFTALFLVMVQHSSLVWDKTLGYFLTDKRVAIFHQIDKNNHMVTTGVPVKINNSDSTLNSKNNDLGIDLPESSSASGSGRLYMWKKTINLIEKRPLTGYGFDTLLYYFPQDDPGKASGLGDPNLYVDKPHNTYLDITFGAGVLSLLAFLTLVLRHLWAHRIFLKKQLDTEGQIAIICFFTAFCAYLVQALINDSNIGTSLIFWILFGAGVSMLRQVE